MGGGGGGGGGGGALTYIDGVGGTHFRYIDYSVPYTDSGGQGVFRRLTSFLLYDRDFKKYSQATLR